jgi:hypothetical protein
MPWRVSSALWTASKKLEQSGIVERRVAPAPQRGIRYGLTPAGAAAGLRTSSPRPAGDYAGQARKLMHATRHHLGG